MAIPERVKSKMKAEGLDGLNKAKRDPDHPNKSHKVMAHENGQYKFIRFGQQGVSGSPKKEGESKKAAARRKSFKARHAKNISKGKMSAAYWSNQKKNGEIFQQQVEIV